jgi:hypothetical protein
VASLTAKAGRNLATRRVSGRKRNIGTSPAMPDNRSRQAPRPRKPDPERRQARIVAIDPSRSDSHSRRACLNRDRATILRADNQARFPGHQRRRIVKGSAFVPVLFGRKFARRRDGAMHTLRMNLRAMQPLADVLWPLWMNLAAVHPLSHAVRPVGVKLGAM